MFSIDRSFSRSNVAVPASADSSSRPTSPESSDWVVAKASSSIVVSCSLQLGAFLFEATLEVADLLGGELGLGHGRRRVADGGSADPFPQVRHGVRGWGEVPRASGRNGPGAVPSRGGREAAGSIVRVPCRPQATTGTRRADPRGWSEPGMVRARRRAPRGHHPRAPARAGRRTASGETQAGPPVTREAFDGGREGPAPVRAPATRVVPRGSTDASSRSDGDEAFRTGGAVSGRSASDGVRAGGHRP